MKIVFLFMSSGADIDDYSKWKPRGPCWEYYNTMFHREGYFILLEKLLEQGVISDLKIFYESNKSPGYASWIKPRSNVQQEVIPHISYVNQFITDETIIWARGGFRHWHDWLMQYKGSNWLIIYAANTGRQKWSLWDIILNDLQGIDGEIDNLDRLAYPFIKPIDDRFYSPNSLSNAYDLCIGASHIHDKKGQWRVVQSMKAYQKLFGKQLKAVMPGSPRRGKKTSEMYRILANNKDMVYQPGFVTKEKLVDIYNASKIFIHLGAHGQNDRSVLEASACGCNIIIGSPQYHAVQMVPNGLALNPFNVEDYNEVAVLINQILEDKTGIIGTKETRAKKFRAVLGLDKSELLMRIMFEAIANKQPTIENKKILANCPKELSL